MDCGLRPCPALITQVHSAAAEATVGQEAGLEGARPGPAAPSPAPSVCVCPPTTRAAPSLQGEGAEETPTASPSERSPPQPPPAQRQGRARPPTPGQAGAEVTPRHPLSTGGPAGSPHPPPPQSLSGRRQAGPAVPPTATPSTGNSPEARGAERDSRTLVSQRDSAPVGGRGSGRRRRPLGGRGGGEPGTDKGARKRALRLRAGRRPPRGLRLRRRRAAGAGEAGARRGVALRLRGVEGGAGGRRARGSHKGGGSVRWGECACAVEVSFPLSPRLRGRETVLSLGLCSPVRWRRLWLLLLEGAGARCLWALWCFGRPEVLLEGLVCVRSPEVGVGRGRAVGLGRGLWGVEGRWFGLLQCQLVYRDLGSYHARRILWPAFWRLKDGRKALSMAEDNNAISNSFRCCRTFSPIWLGYRMKCICSTLPYS